MKKISMMLVMLLMLVGCGTSQKEKTTVCLNDTAYLAYDSSEQIFESKGDVVRHMRTKSVLSMEKNFGVNADEFIEIAQPGFDEINKLEGVHVSIEKIDDSTIYDKMEIDFDTADFKQLAKLGLVQLDENDATFISLLRSVSMLEEAGFTCTAE